ncbi:hypothetical protein [Kordiimonas pumila]|uniref:Bacterial OB-fold domain-containing protein n=1 Tax=Kordiimonas pumila TaxID=2161677 RepID=A0ABV7D8D5_9PROT|nr:hypothetical protein [Kordiimonas pumila]
MSIKNTTAIVSLSFLLASTSVFADQTPTNMTIDQLPEKGAVTLTGVVKEVNAEDKEFILQDSKGDTIDVQSTKILSVKKGDTVTIKGNMDDDFMGVGQEIDATDIKIVGMMDSSALKDKAKKTEDYASAKLDGSEYTAIDALPDEGYVTISGTVEAVNRDDRSFTLRDSAGDTIDVHTQSAIMVDKGQVVKVNGRMDDEVAGMGEQIVSATVKVVKQPS